MIYSDLFPFFKNVDFWIVRRVGKRAKMVQNEKKILSMTFHISGTIHDMIVIYGTHV